MITVTMLNAQQTSTFAGLRGGGVSGITIKIIDEQQSAVELIAGFQHNGMRLVGLLEKYKPLNLSRIGNLYYYTGAGAHSGFVRFSDEVRHYIDEETYYYQQYRWTRPIIGADFVVGVEYRFESLPLELCLDYKPYFEFFGEETFRIDLWDIGFSVRYNFNH
jgi:hypothetical protein